MRPNPSIERTPYGMLCMPPVAVYVKRNDCFSSIRKQAICLYMPRLRIEGPHGVIASKLLALNWSVSLSW